MNVPQTMVAFKKSQHTQLFYSVLTQLVSEAKHGVLFPGQLDKVKREYALICQSMGKDPEKTFRLLLSGTIEAMRSGTFIFFGYYSFEKADLAILQNLPAVQFRKVGPRSFQAFEKRLGMAYQQTLLPREARILFDGHKIQPDRWKKIESSEPAFDHPTLSVEIKPGKNIVVEVKSEGEVIARPSNGGLFTFPLESAHINRRSADGNRFETVYGESFPDVDETVPLDNVHALTNMFMARFSMGSGLRAPTLRQKIEWAYGKLSNAFTGESDFNLQEYNLDFLAESFTDNGIFPGSCKATATVSAGLAKFLGFDARIISGALILKDEGGWGHVWAEISAPGSNVWMPFDPAGGALFTYPDDAIYIAESRISHEAFPLRIKVSYK